MPNMLSFPNFYYVLSLSSNLMIKSLNCIDRKNLSACGGVFSNLPFRRTVSGILLFTFILTQHGTGISYGASPETSPAEFSKTFPNRLTSIAVPGSIGKLEEFFQGKSDKT